MLSTNKRKKIAEEVRTRIAPLCRALARTVTRCNRAHVISNNYLLGTVIGMSDLISRIGAGNTLSDADVRRVTLHVIERLYGRNGVKAAKRAMKSRKAAFVRGVKNGQDMVGIAARGRAELPNKAATQRTAIEHTENTEKLCK